MPTSELPGWIPIRLKSQWSLTGQVHDAGTDAPSTPAVQPRHAARPAACGQVAACFPGAAAVLLGRFSQPETMKGRELQRVCSSGLPDDSTAGPQL